MFVESLSGEPAPVVILPVAEMPSKSVYGYIDPLEGSPAREMSKKALASIGMSNLEALPEEESKEEASVHRESSKLKVMPTEVPKAKAMGTTRELSPLKAENLTQLPVKKKTKQVINNVQEILGYTELHPEVV